jgi:PAS domain S-box-containing protein
MFPQVRGGKPVAMLLLAPLSPAPPSVGHARRLVESALREGGQECLADVVLLLVSEVVTNAVLHACTELELRVRVDSEAVYVEVADGSPILPVPRDYDQEASTGRGLGLVAQLACQHGAERMARGKVVWFEVRSNVTEEPPEIDPEVLLDGWDLGDVEAPPDDGACEVQLRSVPVHLFRAMRQHNDALLREHALMGISGSLRAPAGLDLSAADEAIRSAADRRMSALDLTLTVGPEAVEAARRHLDVLGRADELAAVGGMLTPAALPEVRGCRVWLLEEIARQAQGFDPRPWSPPDVHHRDAGTALHIDPLQVLDALGHAVVVGDDQNRIVFANGAVSDLLGWDCNELVGKRITVLVPERLREQHIAGYTRMLVADGSARILGEPTVLPARCKDGSEVDVELLIEAVRAPGDRPAFVACLRRVSG